MSDEAGWKLPYAYRAMLPLKWNEVVMNVMRPSEPPEVSIRRSLGVFTEARSIGSSPLWYREFSPEFKYRNQNGTLWPENPHREEVYEMLKITAGEVSLTSTIDLIQASDCADTWLRQRENNQGMAQYPVFETLPFHLYLI